MDTRVNNAHNQKKFTEGKMMKYGKYRCSGWGSPIKDTSDILMADNRFL